MDSFTLKDLSDTEVGDVFNSPSMLSGVVKETTVQWTVVKINAKKDKIWFDLQWAGVDLCQVVAKISGKQIIMEEV